MARIARDRAEAAAAESAAAERERLKNMTDAERAAWAAERAAREGGGGAEGGREAKAKWKFMQK